MITPLFTKTILGINKPSQGVRAMVDGIKMYRDNDKFVMNMNHFGRTRDSFPGFCWGCAATATLMMLSKEKVISAINSLYDYSLYDKEWGFLEHQDIRKFESAIDDVRSGELAGLFLCFGYRRKDLSFFMEICDDIALECYLETISDGDQHKDELLDRYVLAAKKLEELGY